MKVVSLLNTNLIFKIPEKIQVFSGILKIKFTNAIALWLLLIQQSGDRSLVLVCILNKQYLKSQKIFLEGWWDSRISHKLS